ncbi:maleylpyruvate isomerase family mycothiol-dependent enzyme [Nocardioides daejeonensis]|uniref:maleylpyruvate isomerase family mycothiol-dependent enzyme n=1 Tax=Nocardioides daejeonensis TaxID=1046556 RepID=UPI0013A5B98F|nr:maleylpyruvate isomerase family mycothiol-dependent enzyme [Nocardioides daejeonensis]
MDPLAQLPLLRAADAQFADSLRALDETELRAPSLLPGWSRAHVAAHVALNGEAFRRVLRQVAAGEPASMYDSSEARDADIDRLASASAGALLERNQQVADDLVALLDQVEPAHWSARVTRLPGGGGMEFPLTGLLPRRLGEVSIHHADLGRAFTQHDWPAEFSAEVVDSRAPRHPSWAFEATDTGASWGVAGTAELVVRGSVADLAWWLTGRGTGSSLSTSTGELPEPPTF